jgi:hypothetical protein
MSVQEIADELRVHAGMAQQSGSAKRADVVDGVEVIACPPTSTIS